MPDGTRTARVDNVRRQSSLGSLGWHCHLWQDGLRRELDKGFLEKRGDDAALADRLVAAKDDADISLAHAPRVGVDVARARESPLLGTAGKSKVAALCLALRVRLRRWRGAAEEVGAGTAGQAGAARSCNRNVRRLEDVSASREVQLVSRACSTRSGTPRPSIGAAASRRPGADEAGSNAAAKAVARSGCGRDVSENWRPQPPPPLMILRSDHNSGPLLVSSLLAQPLAHEYV